VASSSPVSIAKNQKVSTMIPAVQIEFDCIPLRSVPRWDVPIDASVEYRFRCEQLKRATAKHGFHNSYYLSNGRCEFNLTNDPDVGLIAFHFEGTLLTDADDQHVGSADLEVRLGQDTCDWLTAPVELWFHETVRRAVKIEFERFLQGNSTSQTHERIRLIEAEIVRCSAFVGMGL
jgi:hypothetical protein